MRRSRGGRRRPSGDLRRRGRAAGRLPVLPGSGAKQRTARPSGRRLPGCRVPRPPGPRCRRTQSASRSSARTAATALASFVSTTSSASVSRMPACAFTILPNAQKLTPSPYGSERPRSHARAGAYALDVRAGPRGRGATFQSRELNKRHQPQLTLVQPRESASRSTLSSPSRPTSRADGPGSASTGARARTASQTRTGLTCPSPRPGRAPRIRRRAR